MPFPSELRVIVIGQSPRPDMEADLHANGLPRGVRVRLEGALDGLSPAEVARDVRPVSAGDSLFTRLRDGFRPVTIGKKAVTRRIAAMLAAEPDVPTLVMCTGRFKGLPERPTLVLPSAALQAAADARLPRGRLAVVLPLPEQKRSFAALWRRPGRQVRTYSVRPASPPAAQEALGREIARFRPGLVVVDCAGFGRAEAERIGRAARAPVLRGVAVAVAAVGAMPRRRG